MTFLSCRLMSLHGLTTESSLYFVFLDTVVKPRYGIRLLPKTIIYSC
ncbi:palindromic element RPE4 domain-containing protein [Rickettsia tamurae]|nr:palindromic element RPE4 domain-containing protein [Rickettsia tamurae]